MGLEGGVERGAGEVDGEQRLSTQVGQPQLVGGDRRRVGVADAVEVHEAGAGGEAELVGRLGVGDDVEGEHLAVRRVALALDRLEQAVQRPGRLFDRRRPQERATAPLAFDDAGLVQAPDRVAQRVPAHAVLLDQLALGRKGVVELAGRQAAAQVVEDLRPQGERARPIGPDGRAGGRGGGWSGGGHRSDVTKVRTFAEGGNPAGGYIVRTFGCPAVTQRRGGSGGRRLGRCDVFFKQYYLGCLSHASYLIGDTTSGRAVVVDPQRDIARYLADAAAAGLMIERVVETHFHADFLSGHLELRAATGAVISFGSAAEAHAEFPIHPLAHGERLTLGEVVLEIRHTPGHTPESISIVVHDRADDTAPYGVLTGDTLFIGDVGRPDLLASVGVSADELAGALYHSTREQLMTLPDATRVFPAHGAGSACGKFLSSETSSTIGEQKRTNYALQPMTEAEFVQVVTEGQTLSPLYFAFAADRNKQAHDVLAEHVPPRSMSLAEVLAAQRRGGVVLDTRDAAAFAQGHLLGSYNVGLAGRYAEYAGDVLVADQPIVLVCEPGTEVESRTRLARIGFDNVAGCLADPVAAFVEHPAWVVAASRLTADELLDRLESVDRLQLVDVRAPGEVAAGWITGALALPLARILDRLGDLDPTAPTVVYCAGGYRSMIAASVMRAAGFADVSDLLGGYGAWEHAHLPTTGGGAGGR